jgi:hypothetical protein
VQLLRGDRVVVIVIGQVVRILKLALLPIGRSSCRAFFGRRAFVGLLILTAVAAVAGGYFRCSFTLINSVIVLTTALALLRATVHGALWLPKAPWRDLSGALTRVLFVKEISWHWKLSVLHRSINNA